MARILTGWDGSEAADGALKFAAAKLGEGDELLVATVLPARLKDRSFLQMLFPQLEMPEAAEMTSYEKNAHERLEQRVDKLETKAKVTLLVLAGDPADELIRLANDKDVDQLVVGFKSYETDLPFHVGSVAEKLVRYTKVPITVWRPKEPDA